MHWAYSLYFRGNKRKKEDNALKQQTCDVKTVKIPEFHDNNIY